MPAAAAVSERGTGARLVRSLAQQLGGELSMESDGGLAVTLVFPIGARL
jgi:two-component sensor histidine kinase